MDFLYPSISVSSDNTFCCCWLKNTMPWGIHLLNTFFSKYFPPKHNLDSGRQFHSDYTWLFHLNEMQILLYIKCKLVPQKNLT
jgi:hypothetical protein